jgi:hypothetical protein
MAKTLPMFEIDTKWEEEWQGMPEFVQDKQRPYAQIIVRFESEEDLQEFAKMIGQKLNKKTKSIWHPFRSHWGQNPDERYYHVES